ncbi:MAG TPA: hypothetical protein PK306_28320 [Aquabacterium sp.]|nr:hypothetical protein [Aquabacterium sp.]
MLSSLFGDLVPRRLPATPASPTAPAVATDGGTALVRTPAVDSIDVVVDDSPTEAIRRHFHAHRQDLQRASAMVTLLDPSRLWAPQVLQALAAAGSQPVQRLNLRERTSLRTLAVIERTLVPRRGAPALRVYQADIRGGASAAGVAPEEITTALAEGSQLTAVIVGAMQPHALVALLRALVEATHRPEWRCPQIVFILPPAAAALRQRILAQDWPAGVTAHALADSLASAAGVWNRVLEVWEAGQHRLADTAPAATAPVADASAAAAAQPPTGQPADAAAARPPAPDAGLPLVVLNRLLLPLARSEGLLACAIVDLDSGDLRASQHNGEPPSDLHALAEAMCAARLAHQAVAPDEPAPDEVLVTTGTRQTLLRRLPGAARLGFVAVLDRRRANLTLLRFKLLDAERILG